MPGFGKHGRTKTINQMTSFVIALKACWKVRVFVTTVVDNPRNAQAPTGSGVNTNPVIVDKKIDRVRQLELSESYGAEGIKKCTTKPTATEIAAAPSLAPFHVN